MAKYLIQASYSAEGVQGLLKDTASGRKSAVQAALKSLGGKLESFYFCFGADDAVLVVDMPGNVEAAAVALATTSTGAVRLRTTPLLTVDEMDQAIGLKGKTRYRGPGQGK
jgi:uncharacterized protein with GYD domain